MAMPGDYPLVLYRGDTQRWTFKLFSDTAKTIPSDLTGVTVASMIRDKTDGGSYSVEFECTVTLPNIVNLVLDAETSRTLPKKGVWDLELTYPSGDIVTVMKGAVTVTPDATYKPKSLRGRAKGRRVMTQIIDVTTIEGEALVVEVVVENLVESVDVVVEEPGTVAIDVTTPGPQGPPGPPGAGIALKGSVPTEADLPSDAVAGDAYIVAETGDLWSFDGESWINCGPVQGPPGPAGEAGPAGPQGPPGEPGTTSWLGITDKPSAFPPSAHQHPIADVSGLQAALDAKAPKATVSTAPPSGGANGDVWYQVT